MGSERASTVRQRELGIICARCRAKLPEVTGAQPAPGERVCRDCERLHAFRQGRFYEVQLQFISRDGCKVTFFAPDCRTSIGTRFQLRNMDNLRALVKRTDPPASTLAELEQCIRSWGQGSVHLYLTPQQLVSIMRGRRRSS